jgi:hypothetical protein
VYKDDSIEDIAIVIIDIIIRETICHEHMNRDWESQLNCLYYDDTKLKKEEGS